MQKSKLQIKMNNLPSAEQNFLKQRPLAFWLILVILLTIPSFTTLLQPGYFGHHDDLQIFRIYQMDKCFRDGQIPCRWVPDMGYGFGYPLFNFYPVMPYYLGEFIHLFGFSLIVSVKILAILSFLVSGITMFLLGRFLWGNLGGLVSSMFFVYAPYHAVDIYVRGAFAEAWSLAFTPAVFLMIAKVVREPSLKNIILLAIFSALFLTSHNPMALIFTPLMVVWAGIFIVINDGSSSKKYRSIPKLILGGVWGLGLAAFFTVPVLVEGKLVHLETLFIGYFNYLAHFISLPQMFISRFWGWGGSIWGPDDGMPFQIGYLHWGGILLAIPLALILWFKDKLRSIILVYLVLVFWLAAFLMHPRSNPIWEKVTILQTLQFPWRILAVVIFTSSLAVGGFFYGTKRKSLLLIFLIALFFGIHIFYREYFRIERSVPLTDKEKLSGALLDLQRTAGIFDYLPQTAKFPPGKGAKEEIEVISGYISQKSFTRGTNWLQAEIEATSTATLRLPIFDFPKWRVFIDKNEVKFDNQNDLGQPTFEISVGSHTIYAKLYDTPVRKIANLISLISLSVLGYFLFKKWKKH